MEFKDRLRVKRRAKKISQEKLGNLVGVTGRTIQNYELGKRYPSNLSIVKKIAAELDVTPEYLLGTSDDISQAEKSASQRADEIVAEITGLFASGELSSAEKEKMIRAIDYAYYDEVVRRQKMREQSAILGD